MDVLAVTAAVAGSDLGHGPVNVSGLNRRRADAYDSAFADRHVGAATFADFDIMSPAVDRVDDQVFAIRFLIREAAGHNLPDNRLSLAIGWIIDRVVDR